MEGKDMVEWLIVMHDGHALVKLNGKQMGREDFEGFERRLLEIAEHARVFGFAASTSRALSTTTTASCSGENGFKGSGW